MLATELPESERRFAISDGSVATVRARRRVSAEHRSVFFRGLCLGRNDAAHLPVLASLP